MDTYLLKNKIILFLILTIFSAGSSVLAVDDTVIPAGISVTADYILSDTVFTIDDTLTISRTMTNNEATPLTCFYFNENLPDDFTIISHSMTINSSTVSYDFPTPAVSALTGFTEYYFVLDYPGTHGTYDLLVQPNDVVIVEYKVTCNTVGSFDLPLHTLIAHNGTTGLFGYSDSLEVRFDISLGIGDEINLPNSFVLAQNYPNPFTPSTTIEFSIPTNSYVSLKIYNLLGQSVATLLEKKLSAGIHVATWDGTTQNGKTAPSGVYFYKLLAQNREITKKMLLLK